MSKGPLRNNCVAFPAGQDPSAAKHYQEVIDAIEQIYPEAQHFAIMVTDDTGRTFWDVSDMTYAMGAVKFFESVQIAHSVSALIKATP
jgi:hypothetical protein